MRRLLAYTAFVALALLAAAGCGPQGEIDPVPTPLGRPDDGLVLVSSSATLGAAEDAAPRSDGMVAVFGLPGAIAPEVRIVVENPGGAFAVEARVNEDGSFATTLPAAAGDPLRIFARQRTEGGELLDGLAIERVVPQATDGVTPTPPQEYIQNGPGVGGYAITARMQPDGTALVRSVPENAEPGVDVRIGNASRSIHVSTIATEDGSFTASIPARRGDLLVIFVRRADAAADDPTSASEAITVQVAD